ncbi:MAG: glutathione S-transferase family protein [Hoeflea sp.]|uniref:glutathione S-transferase family protein n=1 Tax=Hoeflea sp. TaxID=1940281 RepID=UPI001DEB5F07|nr:glutathione S-transferase family protein [Hoeflea sp.]MBU4529923.1 glutathione S-transferase family protein [Alphaproteobacteria bacterium]MBU4547056.1 glutathione S-transferase family protein [Alphaproteobacteria bacterium]MBU4548669.1 glutathione S-transferase family protein [Alphaproteobacteria bacterium]MBV1722416.1 glutathione S-transferase family protein [Hoeflea sp.]MBV1762428.1 glutathione S-transferase family protein [Hoeflea sp.]
MAGPVLYIGNKNYSSWSFRPWIGMRVTGIAFEESLVPFDMARGNPAFKAFSPTGKVPVLVDDGATIWESLAILDHVARKHPGSGLWPEDPVTRSKAMAMSSEMVSSFQALRSACPMNMRRERRPIALTPAILADVARIQALWSECLEQHGGPFLLGGFSIADAMFAPVVNRLDVYAFETRPDVAGYMSRMKQLPAWREWEAAGRAEPWVVEEDEA